MDNRRIAPRMRTLRSGKLVLNDRFSVIDCVVRNLSDTGACLQVESQNGIPNTFDLKVDGEGALRRSCTVMWRLDKRLGVKFLKETAQRPAAPEQPAPYQRATAPTAGAASVEDRASGPSEFMRGDLLAMKTALDQVSFGVVLLDHELRARFINRAYRKMWQLPDAKADSKPAFVALMYHGRDMRAFAVPPADIDAYIAERVADVKAGDTAPTDIRFANGEVIRAQCTVLPTGGRMLSYTYVTDIAKRSDEVGAFRAALEMLDEGIIVLDAHLNMQFVNKAARALWEIPDELAQNRTPYAQFVVDTALLGVAGLPPAAIDAHIARRIAVVRNADSTPADLHFADGRTIRSRCAVLPGGGRMLMFAEVAGATEQEPRQRLTAVAV